MAISITSGKYAWQKMLASLSLLGLPGSIRTGCPRTPAFKCRYCTEHMNQACTSQPECGSAESSEGESIIEVILAKKVTRSETYYQVRRTN